MLKMESLTRLIGQPIDAPAVQALIKSERLKLTTDPDLEEGEDVRSYLSSAKGGYQLCHTRGRINTLHLYVKSAQGKKAFQGELVAGLSAQSTRADVRHRLGKPTHLGHAFTDSILGRMGAWDRFDTDAVCTHFEYSEPEELIALVTVMSADVAT